MKIWEAVNVVVSN